MTFYAKNIHFLCNSFLKISYFELINRSGIHRLTSTVKGSKKRSLTLHVLDLKYKHVLQEVEDLCAIPVRLVCLYTVTESPSPIIDLNAAGGESCNEEHFMEGKSPPLAVNQTTLPNCLKCIYNLIELDPKQVEIPFDFKNVT